MCTSPSIPAAPKPVDTTIQTSAAMTASLEAERKRRAAAQGLSSTLLTGGQGVTQAAPTQTKTLLGQ